MLPVFEKLAAGDTRQINGPIYGIRVIAAPAFTAAELRIEGVSVPLSALLTLPAPKGRPWNRVNLTGPITVQLALDKDEDIGTALSAGAEGLTDAQLRGAPVAVSGPLTDAQLRAAAVPVLAAGRVALLDRQIVAAGAIVTSGYHDARNYSAIYVRTETLAAGAARALHVNAAEGPDLGAISGTWSEVLAAYVPAAAGVKRLAIGHGAVAVAAPAAVDALPVVVPEWIQIVVPAGGAADLTVEVWGRA